MTSQLSIFSAPSAAAPITAAPKPAKRPRYYQLECIEAIESKLFGSDDEPALRSCLVVMATGTGKTHCFSTVAKLFPQWLERRGVKGHARVLVIAHRDELINQAMASLREITGELVGKEKADFRCGDERIVVTSTQTMHRRLDNFPKDYFALIVIDEAHRATNPSNLKIFKHFDSAKVLGVTATPDRADEKPLAAVFDDVAYVFDIENGINAGYLVPVEGVEVALDEIDISGVATTGSDLNQEQLDDAMLQAVEGIVTKTFELAGQEQTIVFTPGVKSAHAMSERMNLFAPNMAIAIDGETDKELRAQLVAGFKANRYRYLFNAEVFTEGADFPAVSVVVMARPTKSRGRYAQCLDASTQVLTSLGWRGIDDDVSGVLFAAYDVSSGSVQWSSGERVERLLGDEAMFGIDSPHLDIRVTAGHRMVCGAKKRGGWQPFGFRRADSLVGQCQIPVSGVVDSAEADIADCEVYFLGMLLSDGGWNKLNNTITLYQTDKYPDVCERIERCLSDCGFRFGKHTATEDTNFGKRGFPLNRWTVSHGSPQKLSDRHLRGWSSLGRWVSDGKSVTPAFEALSPRQFEILISALNDGNGNKNTHVTWNPSSLSIAIANERLADDLQRLAVVRGWRCSKAATDSKAFRLHMSKSSSWTLSSKASDGRPLFGPAEADPSERVWCVTVSTGAIFIRRNGKVAVVGNCAGRGTRPLPGVVDHIEGAEGAADRCFEIAMSAKPRMRIIDFVGNAGTHSLVGPADILGANYTEDEVEHAKRELKGKPDGDIQTALKDARTALKKAAAALQAARVKVSARVGAFDPFKTLGMDRETAIDIRFDRRPISDGQAEALIRKGLDAEVVQQLDYRSASRLLKKAKERQTAGLATLKQLNLLNKYMPVADSVTFNAAQSAIDYIKHECAWKARLINADRLSGLLRGA